jgi:hypothetical protein
MGLRGKSSMNTNCHDCGQVLHRKAPNQMRCSSCREQLEFVKRRAYAVVYREVRNGRLPKLATESIACVDCGLRSDSYDHRNYDNPALVEPVCNHCNIKRGPAFRTVMRAA